MLSKISLSVLIVLAMTCIVNAQDYQKKIQELDTYIEASRQQWNVPGLSVAIVKDDEVLL